MLYATRVAALEDKIVQKATVAVLNAIYEEDFGSRTGSGAASTTARSDALVAGLTSAKVNHILDAESPDVLRSCMLVPSSTTRWVGELEVLDLTGA